MLIVFGSALAALLLLAVLLHLCGFRYTVCEKQDGTEIKFIGRVDRNGNPDFGTVTYPDKTSAKVSFKNGDVHYSNGSIYSGKLTDGFLRTGHGTLTLKNGDTVTGEFSEDVLNGHAEYHFANGDVFVGTFFNNVKEGEGKYVYADGETYEGGFHLDVRHGKGKMTKPDGTSYDGGYEMGLKWGTGVYVYANGDRYEGDFAYDMRDGKGTYTWADGESYSGDFRNNNPHGYGTYTWVGGRASYTGYFENGKIVLLDPTETAPVQTPAE